MIVNYNGAHFLPTCLDALKNQTYPAEQYEVIVSDNGSKDGSLELLRDQYPWVRVLDNGKNLAFAAGNNAAIKISRGKYVVLLNNDTAPDSNWLLNLVKVGEDYPDAGLVTGHLRLFYDQLVLKFETEIFTPLGDSRDLGVKFFNVDSDTPKSVTQYLDGFYGWEYYPTGKFRWSKEKGLIGVPVKPGSGDWQIHFTLANGRPDNLPVRMRVFLNDRLLAEWSICETNAQVYTLNLPPEARALATPLVQNTGSILDWNGAGRDRGTYVRDFEVFYEVDSGQYNQVGEVFAGCGASLLIRRAMLDDVGLFDEAFFMYYEDTDLAWRARLRGWKVLYAPAAIVRHIHTGSSKEWSPFFYYHVERNRLAMVFKNGRFRQVVHVWGKYCRNLIRLGLDLVKSVLARQPNKRAYLSQLRIHLKIVFTLILWQPSLWVKRYRIQKSRKVSPEQLETWFVEAH